MNAVAESARTIRTQVPARLDRLPWSRFHWRIVAGLGTVWILDGLEVTIVGSIAARLTEDGSGIAMSSADIGTAAAIYIAGACIGALIFGQLTDRYGRKRLFMATLALYLVATVATAFAQEAWYFFLCRFFTGMGIGGEYSAINSAIDELIPARNRGAVDLAINGSYWVGAAIGAIGSIFLLDTSIFASDFGWRLAFAMGAILGLGILFVRRNVPESPRWLFIHGREQEAERIVDQIEAEVREETGRELPEPRGSITVRQREAIPFREIASVAFKRYPRRAILGLALFVGQAFLYNAVVFDLGTILSEFFGVGSGSVPYFFAIFALSNFLGPLLLGRLFDTVGRIPMISGTYIGSAALVALLGILLLSGSLATWSFMALAMASFFLASAGASSAYLTVSEVFPMESRALAIALFYAIGTATGGIIGPELFGQFIDSGNADLVALGFFIGAAVMLIGGITEIFLGVRAEQQSLENIARPLTAEEAEQAPAEGAAAADGTYPESDNEQRIRERVARQRHRDRTGLRRYRPGPGTGSSFYSPGMFGSAGTASRSDASAAQALDGEIEAVKAELARHDQMQRDELERRIGGRGWGPGRFRAALRESVEEDKARHLAEDRYAPGSDGKPADRPDRRPTRSES
jgi:MFS family permease